MTQPETPKPGEVQLNVGAQAVDTPNGPAVAFVFGVGPSQFVCHIDPDAAETIAASLPKVLADAAADVRRRRLGLVVAQNGHVPDLAQLFGGK